MKHLNLDAFAKVTRTLTLAGVTYEVEDMTVENFIATTKAADALAGKKDVTVEEQMKESIAHIMRTIPAIEEKTLRKMSLDQLGMVSMFLRGEMDDKADAAPEVDEEGEVKNA